MESGYVYGTTSSTNSELRSYAHQPEEGIDPFGVTEEGNDAFVFLILCPVERCATSLRPWVRARVRVRVMGKTSVFRTIMGLWPPAPREVRVRVRVRVMVRVRVTGESRVRKNGCTRCRQSGTRVRLRVSVRVGVRVRVRGVAVRFRVRVFRVRVNARVRV